MRLGLCRPWELPVSEPYLCLVKQTNLVAPAWARFSGLDEAVAGKEAAGCMAQCWELPEQPLSLEQALGKSFSICSPELVPCVRL